MNNVDGIEEIREGKEEKKGGGGGGGSVSSREAISATAARKISTDTVEFSWKNAFRVYKTIPRVKMCL